MANLEGVQENSVLGRRVLEPWLEKCLPAQQNGHCVKPPESKIVEGRSTDTIQIVSRTYAFQLVRWGVTGAAQTFLPQIPRKRFSPTKDFLF